MSFPTGPNVDPIISGFLNICSHIYCILTLSSHYLATTICIMYSKEEYIYTYDTIHKTIPACELRTAHKCLFFYHLLSSYNRFSSLIAASLIFSSSLIL